MRFVRAVATHARRGDLLPVVKAYARNRAPWQRRANKNALIIADQARVSASLRRRYSSLLDEGVGQTDFPESNKTWICWFQGEDAMPALVRACANSQRTAFPERETVVLSDANIGDYIELPAYIEDKRKRGIVPPAHYSDLVRVELLYQHGGLWTDATVLCTSPETLHAVSGGQLFVYKQMDLSKTGQAPILSSSWLIFSRPQQRIMALTRKLLHEYWRSSSYLEDYFVFHLFFTMAARRYREDWDAVPTFDNHSPHVLQFEFDMPFSEQRWKQILRMSDFHKLNHHIDYSSCGDSYYRHVLEQYSPERAVS